MVTFYTHPSKAKNFKDHENIVAHMKHMLERIGPQKKWHWIIDGDGFDTDHLVEIRTGMELLQLVTAHVSTLLHIHVINPSVHLKVLLKVITPFLNDIIRPKLKWMDDRPYSILEFL